MKVKKSNKAAKAGEKKKAIQKSMAPKTKKVSVRNSEGRVINAATGETQDGIQPTNVKLKEKPPEGFATIGLAKGVTLNMGEYQSARIDVFIQRNVKDDDAVILDEINKISEMLNAELERQSAELDDM
jgi:hypothetical protein